MRLRILLRLWILVSAFITAIPTQGMAQTADKEAAANKLGVLMFNELFADPPIPDTPDAEARLREAVRQLGRSNALWVYQAVTKVEKSPVRSNLTPEQIDALMKYIYTPPQPSKPPYTPVPKTIAVPTIRGPAADEDKSPNSEDPHVSDNSGPKGIDIEAHTSEGGFGIDFTAKDRR